MENKQTAVEWLEHNIQSDMTFMQIMGLIRQAKEMEKEQIMQAHYAQKYGCFSEDYYNETYGGKDE